MITRFFQNAAPGGKSTALLDDFEWKMIFAGHLVGQVGHDLDAVAGAPVRTRRRRHKRGRLFETCVDHALAKRLQPVLGPGSLLKSAPGQAAIGKMLEATAQQMFRRHPADGFGIRHHIDQPAHLDRKSTRLNSVT